MIYREQSDEMNTETWPSSDMSPRFDTDVTTTKALFSDATNLQLISRDKHYNHVATAVEVSQNGICGAEQQSSEMETSACRNRNILLTRV